jgi:hypothetical protein
MVNYAWQYNLVLWGIWRFVRSWDLISRFDDQVVVDSQKNQVSFVAIVFSAKQCYQYQLYVTLNTEPKSLYPAYIKTDLHTTVCNILGNISKKVLKVRFQYKCIRFGEVYRHEHHFGLMLSIALDVSICLNSSVCFGKKYFVCKKMATFFLHK